MFWLFYSKSEIDLNRKQFFCTNVFLHFFSVIVGCFFDTLTFLSTDKKIAQTTKQMNKNNFVLNTSFFLKKCLYKRALQLWQPGKWFPDIGFFGRNSKEVWTTIYISKKIYLKSFHGYVDCGFRKPSEFFRSKKNSLRNGKINEIFSFENVFQ